MRFVSPHARYTVTIKNPIEEPDPYHAGRYKISEEGIEAQFKTGHAYDYEIAVAKRRFRFNGLPDEYISEGVHGGPVDPIYRISTYDTSEHGFDEKTKAFVEKSLLEGYYHGSDYIMVEQVKLPAPWPGYDKLRSPKKIADLVLETGSEPEDVIAYERENLNRSEVVEAVEALLVPSEPDATVISA